MMVDRRKPYNHLLPRTLRARGNRAADRHPLVVRRFAPCNSGSTGLHLSKNPPSPPTPLPQVGEGSERLVAATTKSNYVKIRRWLVLSAPE